MRILSLSIITPVALLAGRVGYGLKGQEAGTLVARFRPSRPLPNPVHNRMEAAINTITSSIEEAKRMLSVAKEQLRANNVSDIEALNRRVEALQDATVELVQLHHQILSQKNEVGQMLEELGSLNALAVAGAVSSLPALNDLP